MKDIHKDLGLKAVLGREHLAHSNQGNSHGVHLPRNGGAVGKPQGMVQVPRAEEVQRKKDKGRIGSEKGEERIGHVENSDLQSRSTASSRRPQKGGARD